MDIRQFEDRKRDHLRHALDPAHQARGLSGLGGVRLAHEALPELDLGDVRLATRFLGEQLPTPFYVAGMTAGHPDAPALNRSLARASARRGWAMGVGSQRRELEALSSDGARVESIDRWREIREESPGLKLIANIGISQLVDLNAGDTRAMAPVARVRRLADALGASAVAVHANALQEALQPEGTPRFSGAIEALRALCCEIGVPVVLKETGCGFSAPTLQRLADVGLAAVDVSGLGGTHWGRIEGARAKGVSPALAGAAETFADWGVPTAQAVRNARQTLPSSVEIWASGGVRSGLDAAKLVALGAHRVGYAQPALEAALQGDDALDAWMERQELELKIALFCTGCSTPETLRQKECAEWTT